jgi:hypothetical protein
MYAPAPQSSNGYVGTFAPAEVNNCKATYPKFLDKVTPSAAYTKASADKVARANVPADRALIWQSQFVFPVVTHPLSPVAPTVNVNRNDSPVIAGFDVTFNEEILATCRAPAKPAPDTATSPGLCPSVTHPAGGTYSCSNPRVVS